MINSVTLWAATVQSDIENSEILFRDKGIEIPASKREIVIEKNIPDPPENDTQNI